MTWAIQRGSTWRRGKPTIWKGLRGCCPISVKPFRRFWRIKRMMRRSVFSPCWQKRASKPSSRLNQIASNNATTIQTGIKPGTGSRTASHNSRNTAPLPHGTSNGRIISSARSILPPRSYGSTDDTP